MAFPLTTSARSRTDTGLWFKWCWCFCIYYCLIASSVAADFFCCCATQRNLTLTASKGTSALCWAILWVFKEAARDLLLPPLAVSVITQTTCILFRCTTRSFCPKLRLHLLHRYCFSSALFSAERPIDSTCNSAYNTEVYVAVNSVIWIHLAVG